MTIADQQHQHIASATLAGNDTGGQLTITIGDVDNSVQAGDLVKIKFNKAFDSLPQVLVNTRGRGGAQIQFYVNDVQKDYFTIAALAKPQSGQTYAISYYAFQ